MNIGLDIDGVLYPWHDSIYRHFTEFKGYTGNPVEFWDYFRALPKSTIDYYVSIPIFYLDTSPRKDVIETLPKLAELGTIYYITSRQSGLERATHKFFDIYDLPFKENIVFEENKSGVVRLRRIDYYLDDIPRYLDQMKGLCNSYLMTVPHNFNQREGYNTVGSLREFYEIISKK